MEICIVAATPLECALIEEVLSGEPLPPVSGQRLRGSGRVGNHWVDLIMTGIGPVNTAWNLSRALGRFPYKLLVNIGVCGALDPALDIGQVVNIVEDSFADLGAETADGQLLDLSALGLPLLTRRDETHYNRLRLARIPVPEPHLTRVQGLTSSTAHGRAESIATLRAHWPQAQVETMEGAAFVYASLMTGVPAVAIRGVSNRVEPRDRASWRLTEAAEAAQRSALSWIATLPG